MKSITPNSNVKETVTEYPQLKKYLIKLSPKYKKLNNPLIFNTLARKATFKDIAKIGGIPLEELLEKVNNYLDLEYQAPKIILEKEKEKEEKPQWYDKIRFSLTIDVRERTDFFFTELINKLQSLAVGQALVVINDFNPKPLREEALKIGVESYEETLSDGSVKTTFYKVKETKRTTEEKKEFSPHEKINLKTLGTDPFEYILEIANNAKEGNTITIYHANENFPLTKLLQNKGFTHKTEYDENKKQYKTIYTKTQQNNNQNKVKIVLQSATPFLYPFFIKLVQSDKLLEHVDFEIIKVWEETEKHLSWINKGKADISLSAVMVAAKLAANRKKIKLLSVDVWNNFYLLVRGAKPKDFTELPEKQIVMPLFEKAPPASITSYLIKQSGLNRKDFEFIYGSGSSKMGRPNDIEKGFIEGWFNQVLLRQPEASFTTYGLKNIHALSYGELWKKAHPGSIGLPNAGIVVKEEFLQKHPETVELFVEEFVNAAKWVKTHPTKAAKMTAEFMHHTPEEVELFIKNADIQHIPTEQAYEDLVKYFQVLVDSGVLLLKSSLKETLNALLPGGYKEQIITKH